MFFVVDELKIWSDDRLLVFIYWVLLMFKNVMMLVIIFFDDGNYWLINKRIVCNCLNDCIDIIIVVVEYIFFIGDKVIIY